MRKVKSDVFSQIFVTPRFSLPGHLIQVDFDCEYIMPSVTI